MTRGRTRSAPARCPVPSDTYGKIDMDVNTLRILATLASFAAFVGIWGWAWSRSKRASFDEAARIPFQQD